MEKWGNNIYLRVSLITLISLSMLLSTFPFQVLLANAQNSTNNTGILPPISEKQQQQLAANGTSFDVFIKNRMAEMNAARIPVNVTFLNSSDAIRTINLCTSALAKVFGQNLCDLAMSTVYEFCQAIPNQLSYCAMPAK
jgi:hypothetical protein